MINLIPENKRLSDKHKDIERKQRKIVLANLASMFRGEKECRSRAVTRGGGIVAINFLSFIKNVPYLINFMYPFLLLEGITIFIKSSVRRENIFFSFARNKYTLFICM